MLLGWKLVAWEAEVAVEAVEEAGEQEEVLEELLEALQVLQVEALGSQSLDRKTWRLKARLAENPPSKTPYQTC